MYLLGPVKVGDFGGYIECQFLIGNVSTKEKKGVIFMKKIIEGVNSS